MKKVAFMFWHLGIGGIGTRLKNIIKVLKEDSDIQPILILKDKKNQVKNLPKQTFYFSQESESKSKLSFFWWLLKKLLTTEPDYVVAFLNRFSLPAIIYKLVSFLRWKRVKVVINQTVVVSKYLKQYEPKYWHWLVRLVFRFVDLIVVNSQAVKDDLINNFSLRPSKIKVIYNWIEFNKINNNQKKYEAIFVGRLSPEKGIDILVKTAELLKKRKQHNSIAVVGDGELAGWLQQQIKDKKLEKVLVYLGYKKNPLPLIGKAKILLLPSKNEGLPMVILEACSVGVPAIITPFLGAEEVVEDGVTGVIASRGNFPKEVQRLLEDKNRFKKLGVAAKKKANKDFSMDNLDNFIQEIFAA